jgi:hypothetical protein
MHACVNPTWWVMGWMGGSVPCLVARAARDLHYLDGLSWDLNTHGGSGYAMTRNEARAWRRAGHRAARCTCAFPDPCPCARFIRVSTAQDSSDDWPKRGLDVTTPPSLPSPPRPGGAHWPAIRGPVGARRRHRSHPAAGAPARRRARRATWVGKLCAGGGDVAWTRARPAWPRAPPAPPPPLPRTLNYVLCDFVPAVLRRWSGLFGPVRRAGQHPRRCAGARRRGRGTCPRLAALGAALHPRVRAGPGPGSTNGGTVPGRSRAETALRAGS